MAELFQGIAQFALALPALKPLHLCMPSIHHFAMGQQLLLSCCAAPANKIVAQPGTLTGSIGVLTGKLNFGPALADQGVSHDSIEVGVNSNVSSPFADFTKAQIAIQERLVDDIYIDFMEKVRGCSGVCAGCVPPFARGHRGMHGACLASSAVADMHRYLHLEVAGLGGYKVSLSLATCG